jgi:Spy/CpxP family protein refolding chaperone
MKVARLTIALAVVSLMAGSALAQPPAGQGRGPGRGGFGGRGGMAAGFERLMAAVQKLDLTADQKDKFEALKKEYAPKFKDLREKSEKILTDEQKTARADAMKKAEAATGEDRREAYRKVRDAVKLTDDQKKQMDSVMKEGRSLFEEARTKITDKLTDDQKAKLKEAMGSRRGGRRGGNRGDQPKSNEPNA